MQTHQFREKMSLRKRTHYQYHFSPQQLKAVELAIDTYKEGKLNWLVLLAQMQSGKTDAFLLIACELLRQGFIDFIVIFSGNAESELCDQLTDTINNGPDKHYWRKYENYIGEFIDEDPRDFTEDFRRMLTSEYEPKLYIVWGTQKSSYSGPSEKTLFIWEEAHFAQNIDQGPAKFLSKLEISADGTQHYLQEKGNYVLTVSATPFSELSDYKHLGQNKDVIKMKPGEGYTGVGHLLATNRIRKWTTVDEGLTEACSLPRTTKKWAIIRVTDKKNDVKSFMESRGWKCETYDSSIPLPDRKSGKCKHPGYLAWKKMSDGKAPEEDTVIIIKGMCRMGKNIKKDHLLFVFETSKNPASDTILQGLLGRVCGYGNSETIVFLSSKVMKGGDKSELKRYVQLWENPGVYIIPKKANNLTDKNVKDTKPIVPIIIVRDRKISWNKNNAKEIQDDVYDALMNHRDRVCNKNPENHLNQLVEKYARLLTEDKTRIHMRYLTSKLRKDKFGNECTSKTRGIEKANALRKAYEDGEAIELGAGCGHASDGMQVNIWVNKDIETDGHEKEIFYVTTVVELDNDERLNFLIPKTTKREIFAHNLGEGIELVCNGGMPKMLSPETASDWTAMCDQLSDFVEVSRDTAYYKGVLSLGTNSDGEPAGILVNPQVLKELEKGGRIWKCIDRMGAELIIKKSKGRVPRAIEGSGFTKLASIEWKFK